MRSTKVPSEHPASSSVGRAVRVIGPTTRPFVQTVVVWLGFPADVNCMLNLVAPVAPPACTTYRQPCRVTVILLSTNVESPQVIS